ncbi:probable indole-3-pyruvate monooxygenase YUCCA10 [Impatiens glandulifera]|uniref:probable indole-3-pyruvate monooxygenase YUCCA10 n=1 Tax=Impatiens glandulifera TaxID=253017 RepID=UPI001FB0CE98|nr:probable indole-3-pyruvate monooxygenase YUCCA10 [Impatiens glandulifera]
MESEKQQHNVIIVGSGPSGLAMAACLNLLSIPNLILEKEDCLAPLWHNKCYDRLKLHLEKRFCELPHMPFPKSYPSYVSRKDFLKYLDDYVNHFKITPKYCRVVESAVYDEMSKKWNIMARNIVNSDMNHVEEYSCSVLVVATGETGDEFIPTIEGLGTFTGEVIHSTQFKSGKRYTDKNVLVVGSGNSGMEIALDLANHGVKTSIVIRSDIHILSSKMAEVGLYLLKYIPLYWVDSLLVIMSKLRYGTKDLIKHGINRPKEGPFLMKDKYRKYPVIDVGTFNKIISGQIQVFPAVVDITENKVLFENGLLYPFDVIVFATGFKKSSTKWIKGVDENDPPKQNLPKHWKGKNGLYYIGFSRKGLFGNAMDAISITEDIKAHI